jgi:hypothetical protein
MPPRMLAPRVLHLCVRGYGTSDGRGREGRKDFFALLEHFSLALELDAL